MPVARRSFLVTAAPKARGTIGSAKGPGAGPIARFAAPTRARGSPERRWALAGALPSSATLMAATFALMGGPGRLERLPVAPLLLLLLVAHLLNAVVTVALFRRVLPRSE